MRLKISASGAPEESEVVFSFCETVGLPTTFADIGLHVFSPGKLAPAAEKACAHGGDIHHEVIEITPEKVIDAMLAANAIGQWRKKNKAPLHES